MDSSTRLRRDDRLLLVIGAALLAATYAVFSARNLLNADTPDNLLSLKRLLATSIGALSFVLVARRLRSMVSDGGLRLVVALLALASLGAGAVLAARVGYDVLIVNQTEAVLADNTRWLLTWSGYFLAALVGYLALLRRRPERDPGKAQAAPSRSEVTAAIVAEVGQWLPEERRALIAALATVPEYEEADVLPGLNPR